MKNILEFVEKSRDMQNKAAIINRAVQIKIIFAIPKSKHVWAPYL